MTLEELENFLSKTDFDFSTQAGWEDFLAERRVGGTGRDADGIHLRDLKNYAVGASTVITSGVPAKVHVNIRQPGSGLALASAMLYVYCPDASGNRKVLTYGFGGTRHSSADFYFEAGGGGTTFSPHWDVIYYIIIKVGDLPGQGAAKAVGRRVLKESLAAGSWLFRRGFGMLTRGGASFDVTVTVSGMQPDRNQFLDQEILSEEAMNTIRQSASDVWKSLSQ